MVKLTNEDINQITESGRNVETVEQQVRLISAGKKYLELAKPALTTNGRIKQIKESEFTHFEALWKNNIAPYTTKFIPASGAASRMFRALNSVQSQSIENISEISDQDFLEFWNKLSTFPFYNELRDSLNNKGISIEEEIAAGRVQNILDQLLTKEGMDYSGKPKLFLTFHIDDESPRLAMEEHIKESFWLTGGKLHFTLHPDHIPTAEKLADYFIKKYKEKGFDLEIKFSIQDPATDTIALELGTDKLHRNPDGTIFFRQSGHGALSFNIDQIKSNYILVQNVDNLPGASDEILKWKRAFMGMFFAIEERVQVLARGLSMEASISPDLIDEALNFITKDLSRDIDKTEFNKKDINEKAKILLDIINRPIVLAAMVPHKGEPGGGPFAVKDDQTDLPENQIVESAQQNRSDPEQLAIINKSTHFNPVFMILNTKDTWGKKFRLRDFVKREGGYVFYVEKSDSAGKEFASIDTGLWNGEIADMTILFVEMPTETFCPAKTVLDLSPEIRACRKNPYPEILRDISHEEVLEVLNK